MTVIGPMEGVVADVPRIGVVTEVPEFCAATVLLVWGDVVFPIAPVEETVTPTSDVVTCVVRAVLLAEKESVPIVLLGAPKVEIAELELISGDDKNVDVAALLDDEEIDGPALDVGVPELASYTV